MLKAQAGKGSVRGRRGKGGGKGITHPDASGGVLYSSQVSLLEQGGDGAVPALDGGRAKHDSGFGFISGCTPRDGTRG